MKEAEKNLALRQKNYFTRLKETQKSVPALPNITKGGVTMRAYVMGEAPKELIAFKIKDQKSTHSNRIQSVLCVLFVSNKAI